MKPRVAVLLSGYGVVFRGAESMLAELLPRLESRFDIHLYSRSGLGPGGVKRPAIPRSFLEPIYLASDVGRKAFDTLFLDPIHVEWTSHLLMCLPSLIAGRYQVIWHETGLWGGLLLSALRKLTGVKLLDYAHSSHPGWEIPFARLRPDLLVTADPALAARIHREVADLRVEIVPQGVDCDLFRPMAETPHSGFGRPVALFVGALSPEKRPDLAIDAAARSDMAVVVVGNGPLATEVDKQAAEQLGADRYRRLELDRSNLPAVYSAADVLLLPSPLESGARAVLEAMACGTPVVTADDAIRRQLVGEAGILVGDQTPEAYSQALLAALDTDWGERPRQRALSFSLDRQARQFAELLTRLAAEAER